MTKELIWRQSVESVKYLCAGAVPHGDDHQPRGVGVRGAQRDGGGGGRRQQGGPRGARAHRLQRHPRLRRQEGQPVRNGELSHSIGRSVTD